MSRLRAQFLAFFLFATPLHAGTEPPVGTFKMVNTNGFVETGAGRKPLAPDTGTATVLIEKSGPDGADGPDGQIDLNVLINGSEIRLFRLKDGLAALEWNPDGTSLLHSADILALFDETDLRDVPAWGANLEWPGAGEVQLVMLPLGRTGYTGFLISRPEQKTVVRQMEFRQVFGPSHRPDGSQGSPAQD